MLNNNQEIELNGLIKDIDINTLEQGFNVHKGLANMLKFGLLGAYIQNDKASIEKLESKFNVKGSLYAFRAYKTEAKAIYSFLVKNTVLKISNVNYTLETIGELSFDVDMPFSIGSVYKALPKAPKVVNPMAEQNKIIAKACDNTTMKKSDFMNALSGLLGDNAQNDAKAEYDKASEELTNAKIGEQVNKVVETIPAYNLDKVAFMETIKSMLNQVHDFGGDFTEIRDHIMELEANIIPDELKAVG